MADKRSRRETLREEASLDMAASLHDFANDELLREAGADSFGGADCEISEDEAKPAIGLGKIKIRERG
jgi:hypothetical protein